MKYLTAEQLRITEQERNALLKVKAFLKTITNVKDPKSRYGHNLEEVETPDEAKFNMSKEIGRFDYGTACCVGGWMSLQMQGVKLGKKVQLSLEQAALATRYVNCKDPKDCARHPMSFLFYPQTTIDYNRFTTTDAIKQITIFLTTGKATW